MDDQSTQAENGELPELSVLKIRDHHGLSLLYIEILDGPEWFPDRIPAFLGKKQDLSPITFGDLLRQANYEALVFGNTDSLSMVAANYYLSKFEFFDGPLVAVVDTGQSTDRLIDDDLLMEHGLLNIWTP